MTETLNPMKLSNVVASEECMEKIRKLQNHASMVRNDTGEAELEVMPILRDVVDTVAKNYPLWILTATKASSYHKPGGFVPVATCFTVTQNGEELGTISNGTRAGTHVIVVSNHRIGKERKRSSDYKTEYTHKAIAQIKKTFRRRNHTELLEKAQKDVEERLDNQVWATTREVTKHQGALNEAAMKFIFSDEHKNLFSDYLVRTSSPALFNLQAYDEAKERSRVVEQIRDECRASKTVTVVRFNDHYIVKERNDAAYTCTDRTLPEWMRGKLGMLKLVPIDTSISNVGTHVTEDVFLLLPTTEEA